MSARTVFDCVVTVVLVAAALAVAVVAVRREFFPADATGAVRDIDGWRELASSRLPLLGSPASDARVILFSDYQCPYCKDLEGKLTRAIAREHGRIALVRYDLPLVHLHANAFPAAIAARCAARQGSGRAFGSTLFAHGLAGPGVDFEAMARSAGVRNITAFDACVRERSTAGGVAADMAVADRLGIEGVPALIVDGRLYSGTMAQTALDDLLDDAL